MCRSVDQYDVNHDEPQLGYTDGRQHVRASAEGMVARCSCYDKAPNQNCYREDHLG